MLNQRLKALRRQAGAGVDVRVETGGGGIGERIARSRPATVTRGAGVEERDDGALARRLGGALIAPGVILIERGVDLDRVHGRFPLGRLLNGDSPLAEARGLDPGRLLFFDTETSGLAGGSGTVAFMVGMGGVEAGRFVVRQYLLTAFSGEAAMLAAAGAWLAGRSGVVSFNGKCFDAPLLATRHRLARLDDPFGSLSHVDLLAPTRRAFAGRWPDCRLATAERELLGFHRTDDLPGAEAPAAWQAWLREGHAGRLKGVVEHNYWDILSLAALLPLLGEAHAAPERWGADALAVARARLRDDDEEGAFHLLSRANEGAEGGLEAAGLLELARLHRRRGEWEAARALWESLAERGEAEALEQLAKYHEHRRRDFYEAMRYARRLPAGEPTERRRLRLERRFETEPCRQATLF